MIRSTVRSVAMSAVLVSGAAWLEPASAQVSLGEVVVTPGGRPEPRKRVTGTVQVIGRDLVAADSPAVAPAPVGRAGANVVGPVQIIENSEIERSTAKSVTELLAQNAVGFMSEWTPGQTSINIRGAATDGQGRDFKSQVLVLINGHRAGTANLSKMSLADIDRIEIVRGPSSVIYGSQNMGGVINIIMKTGRTAPGTFVEGSGGSWGLEQGKAQNGGVYKGFDWYVGRLWRQARRFPHCRRQPRAQHRLDAAFGVFVARLSDRREQSGRFQHPHGRGIRRRISRLEREHLCIRQPVQQLVRRQLDGRSARRAAQLVLPGLRRQ